MRLTPNTDPAARKSWDCLEDLLGKLKVGDVVTIRGVSAATGLESESVDMVLRALTRAQLFVQRDRTTFVRETFSKPVASDEQVAKGSGRRTDHVTISLRPNHRAQRARR